MADYLYNATCRIKRATSTVTGTYGETRGHGEAQAAEVRCSLRQLSVEKAQGIFGAYQAEAWQLRVVSAQDVPNASAVDVKRDGAEQEWQEFRVQTTRRVGRRLSLYVTRV